MSAFALSAPARVSISGSLSVTGNVTGYAISQQLSGSTTGTTLSPTTLTVTLNGPVPVGGGTTTISGPGAALSTTTLTWVLGGATSQTFTIERATDGTTTVSITNSMGLSNGSSLTYTSSAAPSAGSPQPFTLTAPTTATHNFTLGHAFRQGDIVAGQGVVVTNATAQVTPKNYWPDGSLKFAVIAGSAALTANVPLSVSMAAGTASTGDALTTADLISTGVTANVDAGAFGAASWSGADWSSGVEFPASGWTRMPWVTGHRMSSWIFRKPINNGADDAHLVAFLEVRLYLGGAVEVLPWIENGYINVASPTNKSATYQFTLGGTARLGGGVAIDLKHHQRTVLINGTALSYWLGADPGVIPLHNASYMMDTELVPSYPSASTTIPNDRYAATSFAPLQQGDYRFSANPSGYGGTDSMADAGYSRPLGLLPEWDVLPLACNTAKAYEVCIRNGYSAGRYGIHYRDESTNRPLRFSSYPTLNIRTGQGFKDTGGSTAGLYTPVTTGGNPPTWDVSHSPSVGFMPYLLTGRWYFMEEALFAATCNYLGNGDQTFLRNGSQGLTQTCNGAWQTRAHAWDWRAHVQALAIIPDDDTTLRTEFINRANFNIDDFWGQYVNRAANAFGFIDPGENAYDGTTGRISIWQQDFVTAVWGYAKSLGLPVDSTRTSRLSDFFAWKARSVIERLNTVGGNGFPFENANRYFLQLPATTVNLDYGNSGSWSSANWPTTWAEIYARTAPFASTPDNPIATAGANALATEFDSTSASRGLWADLQPAIAYAVRHGVAGASAARARMIGASNWNSMLASQWAASWPVWSVKPLIDPTALPTWLQGSALFAATPVPNSSVGVPAPAINAWGCLVPIAGTNTLVSAFNGGHNDSSDNGVYALDIGANSPVGFVTKIAPSVSISANVAYQADGRTHSRHGYQHAHYISQRQRVITFGARGWFSDGGGTGNGQVDGVNVSGGTWTQDAAGTFPSIGGAFDNRGFGIAHDPATGNVWSGGGYLWTQATNTWSFPGTYTGTLRWGYQYDALRSRFMGLQWRDGQGYGSSAVLMAQILNPSTGAATNITWASDSETVAALAEIAATDPFAGTSTGALNYEASGYDSARDVLCYYFGHQSNSTLANRWYEVQPQSGSTGWTMTRRTLTGMPFTGAAGINGLFRYMPLLKGFYVHPSATAGGVFVRTSN